MKRTTTALHPSRIRSGAVVRERDPQGTTRRMRQREVAETMNRMAREFGNWIAREMRRAARERRQRAGK